MGGLRLRAALWVPIGCTGKTSRFPFVAPLLLNVVVYGDGDAPVKAEPLAAFEAAALPVTVDEWRSFVEAHGYDSADLPWWQSAGPAAADWLREKLAEQPGRPIRPAFWNRRGFEEGLVPATGITVFEALAFARWAEALYADAPPPPGAPPGGRWLLRVPTERQWAALAHGPASGMDGLALMNGLLGPRHWPHHRGYGLHHGYGLPPVIDFNHGQTRLGLPSAVGVFGRSRSPLGIDDLAGNVLEWCSSRLDGDTCSRGWKLASDRQQASEPALEDDRTSQRALRGGSFRNFPDACAASIRYHNSPEGCDEDFGLRLVRVWVPHSEP